ncbi:MAG: hypothetical protein AB1758_26165, partial [Candidatus Eremiobacterota bacterium]
MRNGQASFSDPLFSPDAAGQDPGQLWAALESFRTGIQELSREFEQTLGYQSAELQEACSAELGEIREAVTMCLEGSASLLETVDPDGLSRLGQQRGRLEQGLLAF